MRTRLSQRESVEHTGSIWSSSHPLPPSHPFSTFILPFARITDDNIRLGDRIQDSLNTNNQFNLSFILLWRVQKCHRYHHHRCSTFHIDKRARIDCSSFLREIWQESLITVIEFKGYYVSNVWKFTKKYYWVQETCKMDENLMVCDLITADSNVICCLKFVSILVLRGGVDKIISY